jgi:hypothetical protein
MIYPAQERIVTADDEGRFPILRLLVCLEYKRAYADIFARGRPEVVNHQVAQMDVRRPRAEPVCDADYDILGSTKKSCMSLCGCKSGEAQDCDTLAWEKYRALIRVGCELGGGHCPASEGKDGG